MKSDDVNRLIKQRQDLAHEALDRMVAENQRLGLYDDGPAVKSYCGGKPNYCTREETLTLDRGCYERGCVAYDERDGDGVNILAERVDKTAKGKHEPVGGEWVPCVKLPVIVHVRNQRDGENHISTREGITPVLPEDLIMRGVAGEEYPIGRELFERTYTFDTAPPKRDSSSWVDCTDEQLMEEVRRRGFVIRDAQIGREWVGLTDEDKDELLNLDNWTDIVEAIEAKLKEKNSG